MRTQGTSLAAGVREQNAHNRQSAGEVDEVADRGRQAITSVDFCAGHALIDLQQNLAKKEVVLALARVNARLLANLERQQVIGAIGGERIFSSQKHCLAADRALRP